MLYDIQKRVPYILFLNDLIGGKDKIDCINKEKMFVFFTFIQSYSMKKKKGKDDFIKKHEYPGGKKALSDFVNTNIRYPEEAVKNKMEGTVYLEYEIDFDGSIKQV